MAKLDRSAAELAANPGTDLAEIMAAPVQASFDRVLVDLDEDQQEPKLTAELTQPLGMLMPQLRAIGATSREPTPEHETIPVSKDDAPLTLHAVRRRNRHACGAGLRTNYVEVLSGPDAKEFLTEVAKLHRSIAKHAVKDPADVTASPASRPIRQLQNHLPKDKKELVAEAYRSGKPVKQIMVEFNIARTTVDRIARQHSIATRKVPALTDTQVVQAVQLYESGLSLARVSTQLDSSPNTVRVALLRCGVVIRPRQGYVGRS